MGGQQAEMAGATIWGATVSAFQQFLNGEFVVGGNRFQHAAKQGAGFQRAMVWNRDVVCAIDAGGEPDVGAVLPHPFVAKHPQGADKVGAVDVARDFQTASASSRTKCRRMICGIGPAAPSPK